MPAARERDNVHGRTHHPAKATQTASKSGQTTLKVYLPRAHVLRLGFWIEQRNMFNLNHTFGDKNTLNGKMDLVCVCMCPPISSHVPPIFTHAPQVSASFQKESRQPQGFRSFPNLGQNRKQVKPKQFIDAAEGTFSNINMISTYFRTHKQQGLSQTSEGTCKVLFAFHVGSLCNNQKGYPPSATRCVLKSFQSEGSLVAQ